MFSYTVVKNMKIIFFDSLLKDKARSDGIFSPPACRKLGPVLVLRPVRLHRLAEFIPWNRFLGSINV
jgi:hypothetical protein